MKITIVIYLLELLIQQNSEMRNAAKRDYTFNDVHLSDHAKTLTDELTSSEKKMFERRQYAAGLIEAYNFANDSIYKLIEVLRKDK